MVYCAAVDAEVNPEIAGALEALRWCLLDRGYSAVAAFDICHYALEEGCLAGAPLLDPEDEWLATEAYIGAMPAVPYAAPEWGDPRPSQAVPSRTTAPLPPIAGGDGYAYTDDDDADWSMWLDEGDPPDDEPEPGPRIWWEQTAEWLDARERGEDWACL